MITPRQLEAFHAVMERGTVTAAAERLGVAPPALSRQISALEDELGVALLTRTTRQVAMTRSPRSCSPPPPRKSCVRC